MYKKSHLFDWENNMQITFIVAIWISCSANRLPKQFLFPIPNGKTHIPISLCFWTSFESNQRSGRNSSGFANCSSDIDKVLLPNITVVWRLKQTSYCNSLKLRPCKIYFRLVIRTSILFLEYFEFFTVVANS